MHCIQGSDAHRLTADSSRKKNLGVGERATEVLLHQASFEELMKVFTSNDFARTRPRRHKAEPVFDFIQNAREDGANIIQDFHESMTARGGRLYAIIADVCAFANTNGGTLYIGVSSDPKKLPAGISNAAASVRQLQREINNRISPPLSCEVDTQETQGKKIIRVLVPRGEEAPYAVDDNKIYVRDEAETGLAVRDEIVQLVLRGRRRPEEAQAVRVEKPQPEHVEDHKITPPRTGVEVVEVE
jgi:hypothetical protein